MARAVYVVMKQYVKDGSTFTVPEAAYTEFIDADEYRSRLNRTDDKDYYYLIWRAYAFRA